MIKKIIVVLLALAAVIVLCSLGAEYTPTIAPQEETTTTASATTAIRTSATTTEATTKPTATEPLVSMPDDETAWANYIVDNEYNYIADRLTEDQQKNVQKMCVTVGCKVSFEDEYTVVTDSANRVVYYSRSFDDHSVISEPEFGVLTLARRADNETTYVYKGATIFDFVSYINTVEVGGFYLSAASSADYVKMEGIFAGGDENGNSVIIKLSDGMIVIALSRGVEAETDL